MTRLTLDTAWNNLALFKEAHFPEQELRYLLEHQEEATPLLLAEVDDAISRHAQTPSDYMRPIYALFVLAHFRCEELFPRLIALLKLIGEGPANLLETDHLAGYGLPNIIASTFNGEFALLAEIIEDKAAGERARACALSSIIPLVFLGKLEREKAIAYLTELTQTKLEDRWVLWVVLVEMTMDLYLEELKPIMMDAFSKDIVDGYCTQEELINHFEMREEEKEWHDELMEQDYHFIDAINDIKLWSFFQSQIVFKKRSDALADTLVPAMQSMQPLESARQKLPVVRGKKIGRNEPCPCGSAKKIQKMLPVSS